MDVWSRIANAIGYPLSRVVNGVAYLEGSPPEGLGAALVALPNDKREIALLSASDPAAQAFLALLTTAQKNALRVLRQLLIAELRIEQYEQTLKTNALFFDLAHDVLSADGTLSKATMQSWLDAVDAVKLDLPMPT